MKPFFSIFVFSLTLCFLSCEAERRYLDASGEEIDPDADGPTTLEERFTKSFDVKKNKDGVPEASSQKVSSFQGRIDSMREEDGAFSNKSYHMADGSALKDKMYSGSGAQYGGAQEFSQSKKSAFTPDLVPDFMKPGKGITQKTIDKSSYGGTRTYGDVQVIDMKMSGSRTSDTSGYFETRKDRTPPPVIINRQDYARKVLKGTGGLSELPKLKSAE